MKNSQSQPDVARELLLDLPERHYLQLRWLKAVISQRKRRPYTIEETVALLLHREERLSQLKLWCHTLLVFLGITAVLFLPLGVSLGWFLIFAAVGVALGGVSFLYLTPQGFKRTKPGTDSRLVGLLERLSQRAGLNHPPRLMVLDTPEINALAVSGKEPAVILTQGLVDAHFSGALSDEELGAIIGHELGHIKHHDGLRRSMAYAWISIFSAGGEIAKQLGSSLIAEAELEGESGLGDLAWRIAGLMVVCCGLFGKVLAKIASALYFYLSRKQEHDADDLGAQLTHPRTMATALQRIEELNHNLVQEELRELPFPDLWQVKPRKLSIVDRLWTTHPPAEERRTRLEGLAQFV